MQSEEFKGTLGDIAKSDMVKDIAGDVAGEIGVAEIVDGALDNDLGKSLQSEEFGKMKEVL